jgi:putative aldouronate transport system permease protein
MSNLLNTNSATTVTYKKKTFWQRLCRDFALNKHIYLMVAPAIIIYLIFEYLPMYGVLIAFKEFSPAKGVWGSKWVGLQHYKDFLSTLYFWRLVKNTFLLSFYNLLWGFPAPIIFALLLNEIRGSLFKRVVQTISYLPHFVSIIVICGLITDFLQRDGLINSILVNFGFERVAYLMQPQWFRTIYVSSGIWQTLGWSSIVYISALTAIDAELYQAASIDGANRWMQLWSITIPGILPTIIILFIMRMGHLLSVGFEKILLLYNSNTYEVADVISTYVYRKGIMGGDFSFSTAVGLLNSLVNLSLLLTANWISKRTSETSLW